MTEENTRESAGKPGAAGASGQNAPGAAGKKNAKALAAALRANLQRRKARERALKDKPSEDAATQAGAAGTDEATWTK